MLRVGSHVGFLHYLGYQGSSPVSSPVAGYQQVHTSYDLGLKNNDIVQLSQDQTTYVRSTRI